MLGFVSVSQEQIVFKNKNEHSWVCFGFILFFFSYWMGLGIYIDAAEYALALLFRTALLPNCGYILNAILTVLIGTFQLGLGSYFYFEDKGITSHWNTVVWFQIMSLYLCLVILWFITHNFLIRFDPQVTQFNKRKSKFISQFCAQHQFIEEVIAGPHSSFNVISNTNLDESPKPITNGKVTTAISSLCLLAAFVVTPIPHIIFLYQSHQLRATSYQHRVKHTIAVFYLLSLPVLVMVSSSLPFLKIRRSLRYLSITLLTLLLGVLFLTFFDIELNSAHFYRRGSAQCDDQCIYRLSLGSVFIISLSLASFYWSTLTPLFRRLSPSYRMFSLSGFLLVYSSFPFLLIDHFLPTSSFLDQSPIICGIILFITAILIYLVMISLLLYTHISSVKRHCLQRTNYRYLGHWVNNTITLGSQTAYFTLGYFYSPVTTWGYASVRSSLTQFVGGFFFIWFNYLVFLILLYLPVHAPQSFKYSTIYEYWLVNEYDLVVYSFIRKQQQLIQLLTAASCPLVVLVGLIVGFNGPSQDDKYYFCGFTIMIAYVCSAISLILLIQLKQRLGPFAKATLPLIVIVLWVLVLVPIVVGIPLATLVPSDYYDSVYSALFLWAVVSILIGFSFLFFFLSRVRMEAQRFHRRDIFKRKLKKALIDLAIMPRESALNEVVDFYMRTNQLQGQGSIQQRLQLRNLVYFWDSSYFAQDQKCSKVLITHQQFIWLNQRTKTLKREVQTLQFDQLVHWRLFLEGRRSMSEHFPFDQALTYVHYIEQPRPQRKFSNLFSLYGNVRYETDHDIYQKGHAPPQQQAPEKEPGIHMYGGGGSQTPHNQGPTQDHEEGGQLTNRALISKVSQEQKSIIYEQSLHGSNKSSGLSLSEWTEHDVLFYNIKRVENRPYFDQVRNLLLQSIEACFALIEETFFYFSSKTDGDQKIMLTSDYDSFALLVLGYELEQQNAIEEVRELLAKLRSSDQVGGRLRNESFKEFKLFLEEWACIKVQNAVKRQQALQILCANIIWARLSVHDRSFTDPHFLLILLGASLQYRTDFSTFILNNLREDIQYENDYHIVKVQLEQHGFCTRKNYLCPHNICTLLSFLCFFQKVREDPLDLEDVLYDASPEDTPQLHRTALYSRHPCSHIKCANYQDHVDLLAVRPSSLKHPQRRRSAAISAPSWQQTSHKIVETLYDAHRFMNDSFYRSCECSCMNSFLALFSVLEHYVVIALLFLYELGWDDPTHPVASIAFFPDNPERRDSYFQSLFISTVVLCGLYFALVVLFLYKSKKGLLGYDQQTKRIIRACSLHNFLYLVATLLATVLFFNFMSIYLYVFSCDVEANKQIHHRESKVVCWDGGPHLAWSIVTIFMLLIYYPLSALTWPFLQTVNLTHSLKYNPNYLCFFNHVKILLIACTAFLKNSHEERILRVVLIALLFAFLLVIAILMAPCALRGLNWLLIMMVCSCFWIALSMIIFVVRSNQFEAELLIGIGVGFVIFIFLLILLVRCYFKKRESVNPNLELPRPQFTSQSHNHSLHQGVSQQIVYPPALKEDTEQANNKYPPEQNKGSIRLEGGMRRFDKQTFRFQRNFLPQMSNDSQKVSTLPQSCSEIPMPQTMKLNCKQSDQLPELEQNKSPILLESSFKLHENMSVPQFTHEEPKNFFEHRRRSLESSPFYTEQEPQTEGNDRRFKQSESPRRSLGEAQSLARETARRVTKTMESAEFRKEKPW